MHLRRSARKRHLDAKRLKGKTGDALTEASSHAGKTATQVAEHTKEAAVHAKDWATPRVEAAVDWASPRVEKAWRESVKAAAPRVEKAAEKAVPLVDTAHDRLVDDLLPKLVAGLNAAAASAAVGADKARDVTSAKLTELAHIEVPKKRRRGAKIFWVVTGLAAVAAAVAAWRASRPTTDPWAEQPWEQTGRHEENAPDRFKARAAEAREELGETVTDVRHELGDAAEAVGEVAGEAVAKTREATEKAAERAKEATRKAAPRRKASSASSEADATTTEALSTSTADDKP